MPDRPPHPQLPSDTRFLWERATDLDREARYHEEIERDPHPGGIPATGLKELLDVGREVGISPESVLLSVAESRLPDGAELRPRGRSPLWHQLLVEAVDALEVGVRLEMSPPAALALIDGVLARPGYRMELEDRLGDDLEEESVSVFRMAAAEGSEEPELHEGMGWADGRVLIVTTVRDPAGGTRVRIRMPHYERGANLALSVGTAGLAGVGGASAGAALGEAIVGALLVGTTGLLPLALVVAPAIVGTYVGAGAGIFGFRRLQKWGFGKGKAALKRLVRALEMEAKDEPSGRKLPPA